jgi:hypothetical protein
MDECLIAFLKRELTEIKAKRNNLNTQKIHRKEFISLTKINSDNARFSEFMNFIQFSHAFDAIELCVFMELQAVLFLYIFF